MLTNIYINIFITCHFAYMTVYTDLSDLVRGVDQMETIEDSKRQLKNICKSI